MCQVVKKFYFVYICICIHILYQSETFKRIRDVRKFSYLSPKSLPNEDKKIHEKRMKKTSMHVKITYPVDRQYMPYLPRVWRMDTDAC